MITILNDEYFLVYRKTDQEIIDKYHDEIQESLKYNLDFILFTQYISPPLYSVRYDGEISIAMFNNKVFEGSSCLHNTFSSIQNFIYSLTYRYFNKKNNSNYKIIQLGQVNKFIPSNKKITNSKIVMPHKGNVSLLERCLYFLQKTEANKIPIDIVFDSFGYKKTFHNYLHFGNINVYKNKPLNVGPYFGRHHSILSTDQEYIFFQDSDDISIKGRFISQLSYLIENKLDMVGSHELRIDQFSKTLKIIRFPIDVSKALTNQASHPLFHPTSVIRKSKYLESLGFSLNRKFGSDSQFLLRSYFSMKIGNIDEIFYIRFKRQNSLTTNSKTNLNSIVRKQLDKKWKLDFEKIKKGKAKLADSSLAFENFNHEYEFLKIDYGQQAID